MNYVPAAGDLVWLHFDPQAGHEQAGLRPALVLTPERYNRNSGFVICCPSTTRIKGYAFEYPLGGEPPSVLLTDQARSMDWRARGARRKGRVSEADLEQVRAIVAALIQAK